MLIGFRQVRRRPIRWVGGNRGSTARANQRIRPVGGAHPVAGVLAEHAAGRHHRRPVRARASCATACRPRTASNCRICRRSTWRSSSVSLIVVFLVGVVVNLQLLMPVFRWQRRDNLLAETDPAATELARSRALRMPFYRTLISMAPWCIGGVVFIVASWSVAKSRGARRGGRHRAGRHRDRDHRLPAVRAGAAAGGGGGAAQRGAGERQGARRHPAADADLDAVHRACRCWRSCWPWWPTRFRCCMPRPRSCSPPSCCWRWRRWASG